MTAVLLKVTPTGPTLEIVSNDARMFELSNELRKAGVAHEQVYETAHRTRLIVPVPDTRKEAKAKL